LLNDAAKDAKDTLYRLVDQFESHVFMRHGNVYPLGPLTVGEYNFLESIREADVVYMKNYGRLIGLPVWYYSDHARPPKVRNNW
jgi:hypothetical protein